MLSYCSYSSVVWSTKNTTNNVVCYGDRVSAVNCIEANVSTYSASDLCGSPANSTGWSDPGQILSATMIKYDHIFSDDLFT